MRDLGRDRYQDDETGVIWTWDHAFGREYMYIDVSADFHIFLYSDFELHLKPNEWTDIFISTCSFEHASELVYLLFCRRYFVD